MELQVSARVVAQLVSRLAKPRLTPIAEAAAKHEKRLAGVFTRSVKAARALVPMRDLEDVLGLHGGWGSALYVVQDVVQAWADALMGDDVALTHSHGTHYREMEAATSLPDALASAARAGAKAAVRTYDLAMSFTSVNPAAIAWAHDHAALLITSMSDDVKDAIRLTVVQSFEEGIAPRDVAKLIRANIGLTERDAGAVMKRQLKLLADGMSPARAVAAAEKYADKLVRSRALTIARTEGMRAANEGQRMLWEEARKVGLLSGLEKKVWITADPCPICEPLEGETVGMNESFSIGTDPPAHPRCRCTIGLV